MKIVCPFTIGEWDKDNILRGEIGATYDPQNWNRASTLNMTLAKQCFEAAESSDYIEYCFHGLLHGNYSADGKQITELEYFDYKDPSDGLLYTLEKEDIERRFELYYKIYDSWGFQKKIRTFSSPTNVPKNLKSEDILPLAEVLESYGIYYWLNRWKGGICYSEFLNNVIYLEKNRKYGIPWNAYDYDPKYLFDFAEEGDEEIGDVMSTHWPNFLRFNYQKNMECLEPWVKYFKKQSEIFGVMLSKDIVFCTNQHLYRKFSDITFDEKKIIINTEKVFSESKLPIIKEFYISLKNDIEPSECIDGKIELYETHENFKNYKITHDKKSVEILLK